MISIAMTTYNGEKFLKEQLDSILDQDYSDFELVICDDCSIDSTRNILKEYSLKDDRIRVILNDRNLGFKKNFEKCILHCNGEYIALSDQDDIWERNHLSQLIKIIGNNFLACGDAMCYIKRQDGWNKEYSLFQLEGNFDENLTSFEILKRILYKKNPFQGASMLLSKKFVSLALPIPEDIPFHDVWFALIASYYDSIVYTQDIINNYRQHSDSVTKRDNESITDKIKKLPRYSINLKDRINYLIGLSKIIDDTDKVRIDRKEFINKSVVFFEKIENRKYRWVFYKYYKKNIFNEIYRNTSLKNRIAKCLQYLFF